MFGYGRSSTATWDCGSGRWQDCKTKPSHWDSATGCSYLVIALQNNSTHGLWRHDDGYALLLLCWIRLPGLTSMCLRRRLPIAVIDRIRNECSVAITQAVKTNTMMSQVDVDLLTTQCTPHPDIQPRQTRPRGQHHELPSEPMAISTRDARRGDARRSTACAGSGE